MKTGVFKTVSGAAALALTLGVFSAEQLLPNGSFSAGRQGWYGGEVSLRNVLSGRYCVGLTLGGGGARLYSSSVIPVNAPVETFYFTGAFMADREGVTATARVLLHDRYGNVFELTGAKPVEGSATSLLRGVKSGERRVNVKPNPMWKADDDLRVAFGAAADNSDLPTLNLSEGGIAAVRKADGGALSIELDSPLKEDHPAGPVRLHRAEKMAALFEALPVSEGKYSALSGSADCGVYVPAVTVEITFSGPADSHVWVDDLQLSTSEVRPVAGGAPDNEVHSLFMQRYAELGWRLDAAVNRAGSRLSVAAMVLELKGEDASSATSPEAEMLRRYRVFCDRLAENAESYSAAFDRDTAVRKFQALETELTGFEKQCAELAAEADEIIAGAGGVPDAPTPKVDADYLLTRFILGMDVNAVVYGENRFVHPGNSYDHEFVALAMRRAKVNLVSVEDNQRGEWRGLVTALDRYSGAPFMVWTCSEDFANSDSGSYIYFNNLAKLKADVAGLSAKYAEFRNFAGFELDEPRIADKCAYGDLTKNRAVMSAWNAYAQELNQKLRKQGVNGVSIPPRRPTLVKGDTPNRTVPFVAWQLFKKDFLGEHLKAVYAALSEDGKLVSSVITDWNHYMPQETSFVSMAGQVPYIGADLYNDGSLRESFSMQLLRSAALNRAILWPGAGYSAKSVGSFNRSLAVGLAYADGIHTWTYQYCSKFRDPELYWKWGGKECEVDDMGRLLENDWDPAYWNELEKCYRNADAARSALDDSSIVTDAAIVYSERQAVILSEPTVDESVPAWRYYDGQVGLYSAFTAADLPVAVEYLEKLTPERAADYKVLVIAGAESMSAAEANVLMDFVKNGGTLVCFGRVGTCDEWGLPLPNSRLLRATGARMDGVWRGCGTVKTPFGEVSADRNCEVLKMDVQNGASGVVWNTRGYGFISNKYGDGVCYSFPMLSGGYVVGGRYGFYPGLDGFFANLLAERADGGEIAVEGLPPFVEPAFRRSKDGSVWAVVLINRTELADEPSGVISGHTLRMGGDFTVFDPAGGKTFDSVDGAVELPAFNDYQLLVVTPAAAAEE